MIAVLKSRNLEERVAAKADDIDGSIYSSI